MTTEHTPNRQRIPQALDALDWQPVPWAMEYEDGAVYLVAVPVSKRWNRPWNYEFAVVTIRCYEDRYETECNSVGGRDL